jgi:hypothetical protein
VASGAVEALMAASASSSEKSLEEKSSLGRESSL